MPDTRIQDLNGGTATTPASGDFIPYVTSDGLNTYITTPALLSAIMGIVVYPGGRLTLESGVPISTTDQADKTTLYYTPYISNQITLYDGVSVWSTLTFSELSLDVSAFTASKVYDIWAYNNSGTVTLDSTVWTNDTTRATALTYQDGRLVKTGATTRLYLGTIYIDSGQKCQDTVALRYVDNFYNQTKKRFYKHDSTNSWSYTTAVWRSANNSTANRVNFVLGTSKLIEFTSVFTVDGQGAFIGVGIDKTNASDSNIMCQVSDAAAIVPITSYYAGYQLGFHYAQMVEYGGANVDFYGDANVPDRNLSGLYGNVMQ